MEHETGGPALSVKTVAVDGRRARRAFIRFPWSLYGDDPAWVPPLLIERGMHLSAGNPFFEHAECRFWLAFRDGRPVGRISAQVDRLHIARYGDATGFWGMLESENRPETAKALFDTAEAWLRQRGMTRARGPFNLSINQECGLLVEGFDTPPSVMMGHARPYYGGLVEACGYGKARDLVAYTMNVTGGNSRAAERITRKTAARIRTRTLRRKRFREEMNIVRKIYNDAWSDNWGFVPFTDKEFEHLGSDLKLLLNDHLVRIAEIDGQPAAFMVMLPNLNEAIGDLDGRLWPLGWLRLLWRLKARTPRSARVPLMGVLKRYQGSLLGAALAYRVIGDMKRDVQRLGIRELELSWILEDNRGVRGIIENVGGRAYKTYRIYTRDL